MSIYISLSVSSELGNFKYIMSVIYVMCISVTLVLNFYAYLIAHPFVQSFIHVCVFVCVCVCVCVCVRERER